MKSLFYFWLQNYQLEFIIIAANLNTDLKLKLKVKLKPGTLQIFVTNFTCFMMLIHSKYVFSNSSILYA